MDAVDEGKPELEIAREMPVAWSRNLKALDRYKLLTAVKRDWPVQTICLWGPSGSGKSKFIHDAEPDAYWVSRGNNNASWYDGYDGDECVVFDDFYGWISRDQVQRICDRYPMQFQTKGGTRMCQIRRVYFTANEHPKYWWKIGLGAMTRRFDEIRYVDYSVEHPCIECCEWPNYVFPHAPTCTYQPPRDAPAGCTRGPASVAGYVGADGTFIPL